MLRRKGKVLVSLLLAVTMFATASPVVYALGIFDMDEYSEEERRRIEMIVNSPNSKDWIGVVRENVPLDSYISFYPNCADCGVISVSVCAKEANLYDEGCQDDSWEGTETDCYAYHFQGRGSDMCPMCAKVIFMYGRHD